MIACARPVGKGLASTSESFQFAGLSPAAAILPVPYLTSVSLVTALTLAIGRLDSTPRQAWRWRPDSARSSGRRPHHKVLRSDGLPSQSPHYRAATLDSPCSWPSVLACSRWCSRWHWGTSRASGGCASSHPIPIGRRSITVPLTIGGREFIVILILCRRAHQGSCLGGSIAGYLRRRVHPRASKNRRPGGTSSRQSGAFAVRRATAGHRAAS